MNRKKLLSLLLIAAMLCSMCACAYVPALPDGTAAEAVESIEENADVSAETKEPETGDTAEDSEALASDYSGGNPWIDSDIKENITDDMETSPKDDFHLYINKEWLLNAEFKEGMTAHGPFMDLYYTVMENAKSILTDTSLSGEDVLLVQSLYNAVLDWDARNAAGVEPIRPVMEDIQNIENIEGLSAFLCNFENLLLVSALINFGNITNFNDSTSYIFAVAGSGFLLGDAAEYTERTDMGERYYNAYKKAAIAMLGKFDYGEDEAAKMFDDAISFEEGIAKVSLTSADHMDPSYYSKINNIYTLEEAEELLKDYPLKGIMDACGYKDVKECIVFEPDVLKKVGEIYNDDNVDAFKNYMIVRLVVSYADELDRDSYEIYAKLKNEISGSTGMEPDEDKAYSIVKSRLYEPLARAYMQKYDAAEKKENITRICEEIIAVYKEMLAEEDWMTEETRDKAIEKLDNIKINAVYPEKWVDTSSLKLDGLSYFDMLSELAKFNVAIDVSHTNGRVDKDLWNIDILEQNAYYNQQDNSINIILGFLGDEYYSDDFTKEQMYGAIGGIIGHEISHAFDTNGSQFDKDGNMVMWWTEEDYDAFTERAAKLIAYYDQIEVYKGASVPGNNIQSEAIADMAGIKAMLKIAEDQEDFDYDKFFTQYAVIYRRINTPEMEDYCLNQDVHPLHYLRTNCTLQQFDEFLDFYDIKEGDNMYLAPEDRVLVW